MPSWVILLLLFLASQGYGFPIQGKSANTLSQRMSDRAQEDEAGWTTVPDNSQGRSQLQNGRRRPRNDKWSENPPVVEPIPQDDSNCQFEPFMLLLAGLPGCGKSTFARMLVEAMPYKFARVNQDEMGTRKKCVANAKQAMSKGLCVIVDRCNFDASQRQVWYQLAAEYKYPVDVLVLQVPISLCIQRCQQRSSHETIEPKDASRIVNMVNRQWEMPSRDEQIKYLRAFRILDSSQQFNEALGLCLSQK